MWRGKRGEFEEGGEWMCVGGGKGMRKEGGYSQSIFIFIFSFFSLFCFVCVFGDGEEKEEGIVLFCFVCGDRCCCCCCVIVVGYILC